MENRIKTGKADIGVRQLRCDDLDEANLSKSSAYFVSNVLSIALEVLRIGTEILGLKGCPAGTKCLVVHNWLNLHSY